MEIQNHINGGQKEIKNKMKKKRSRGLHVIGIVLHLLRRRRRSKPFLNGGFWRRFGESIRQLKNDDITKLPSSNTKTLPSSNVTVMPPSSSPETEKAPASSTDDQLSEMIEVFTATSSSCSSGISGYGSAKSLRDMDCLDEEDDDDYNDDDDDDEEYYGNDDGGDEMIDAKAEEFIVRFYEQMRVQNQVIHNKRYKAKETMMMV